MSKEADISSWLHANFESGIDTDVVPKEQLWQSYLETLSTVESGNKIGRDQFFAKLGVVLKDDDFKAVKTLRNQAKKTANRFLTSKKAVNKEVEVKERKVLAKASKVINVGSKPLHQGLGANQHMNDMGEGSSLVLQENPFVQEREPDQKRKTSPLNLEAEKEKDDGSMKESKLLTTETDPPPQDLRMNPNNPDYVSDSDAFHKKGNDAVTPVGLCEEMVQDVLGIETGGPSQE